MPRILVTNDDGIHSAGIVALAQALETLPEHEREALELRVVGELPYADVAAQLGVRPAAARLRVSRALRRLSALTLKEDT